MERKATKEITICTNADDDTKCHARCKFYNIIGQPYCFLYSRILSKKTRCLECVADFGADGVTE